MADINLAGEPAIKVLEASAASALSQAEAVDRFIPWASLEHGALAGPVGNLGRPEHSVRKVGGRLPIGVGLGLGFARVVHEDDDDARSEIDDEISNNFYHRYNYEAWQNLESNFERAGFW